MKQQVHYSQPKYNQNRPLFNGIKDDMKNLIQSPSSVDMAESLDLIQYKYYQDIMKQKADHKAQKAPLSYSKSIQQLGKDTNIFLQQNQFMNKLDNNNTKKQNENQQKRPQQSQQNSNFFKNSDIRTPAIQQSEYWGPVDFRVQKLMLKSTQRQKKNQLIQEDNFQSECSNQCQQIENDFLKINESQFNNKSHINIEQDKFYQFQNQDSINTSNFQNQHGNFIGLSSSSSINKNGSSQRSSFQKKRENLLIQEKFALNSPSKIDLKGLDNGSMRQFTPLKLNPPFVKKPYSEKSKTYTMGFLKAQINEQDSYQPNVIHANNRLRQPWQNRIGNSQSKSSLVNEEMMHTNGWKQFRQTSQKQFFQIPNFDQQELCQTDRETNNNHQFDDTDKNQSKSNFEQLMIFANYKNNGSQQQYHQEENQQMMQNEIASSEFNIQPPLSNRSHLSHLNYKVSTRSFNKTKSDGFNHFYKSNLLKNDLEKIQTQKIKAQLSNQQGFKQQTMISEAQKIIQNQLPGSKIILKQVHQRNLSQKSDCDSHHRVYYTLPERVNFFKSKNLGVSTKQSDHQHHENVSVK